MIAFVPAGSAATASSRLRAFLPSRYLHRAGWASEIFRPERGPRYRVVVFQKAYRASHRELARALRLGGARIVFDLCDNHFHYALDRPEERAAREHDLEQMLRLADRVTVSTPALAEVIRERTGVCAHVIDDAVDVFEPRWLIDLLRRVFLRGGSGRVTRLLWFGAAGAEHPPFGMVDLGALVPRLQALRDELHLTLTVVSNSAAAFRRHLAGAQIPTAYRPWTRWRCAFELARHRVTVVPVNTNPLTWCKTANRPLHSLAHGVPVVADPLPSYQALRDFLVLADWEGGLRRYATEPAEAGRHVRAARRFIEQHLTPRHIATQWRHALQPLLAAG